MHGHISNGDDTAKPLYDCLIIGGGPAGLSAATTLARQLYRIVVFDSGSYRDDAITHMGNVATWDNRAPEEFRETARRSVLDQYSTVRIEDTTITHVKQAKNGHFEATSGTGARWYGRKLLLATGVRDVFPDISGYQECWAVGICPDLFWCDREKRRAQSAGVLAIGDMATPSRSTEIARMARRLADNVTIYTDSNKSLSEQLREDLGNSHITVDARSITHLEKSTVGHAVIIHFDDLTTKTEDFLAHESRTEINGPFAYQLGLDLSDQGNIKVTEPLYATSVAGVFAVGDCACPTKAVVQAMATGALGATGVSAQLIAEIY
ncbi:hypothetical protein MMC30_004738 [Trapelia coarctata]|nr:hypothetical protein [Trapelia coarctata]